MEIRIISQQNITGRGLIFLVDLKENGFTKENSVQNIPFAIGSTVTVDDIEYFVRGVEAWRIMNDRYKTKIGLQVTRKYAE